MEEQGDFFYKQQWDFDFCEDPLESVALPVRYLLHVKTIALQETFFEVTLPLGNKGPLNLPLEITNEAHMLDYFFFFQCQEHPVFVPC